METKEVIEVYPRLYHMAHADAWPGIQQHGLLSTSALLDLFEIKGDHRYAIEACRRPENVVIEHPVHGRAVIRDNKPISDSALARCLEGISPADYYCLLNSRVFFWLTEQRLRGLLNARAFKTHPNLVLTIDTASLIDKYEDKVTLSPINSGSTLYNPPKRGAFTFKRIGDYDFEYWRQKRSRQTAIAELAVDYAIPDITPLLLKAEIHDPDGSLSTLWTTR